MPRRTWPRFFDRAPLDERQRQRLLASIEKEGREALDMVGHDADSRVYIALTIEAADLARDGDLDGAKHRLRLRDHPKWFSGDECQRAYDRHMAQQRQGATP